MKPHSRTRVVAFRVTEGEYETLKSASLSDSSCVSEVARDAVVKFARSLATGATVESRLDSLDQKLDRLLRMLGTNNE